MTIKLFFIALRLQPQSGTELHPPGWWCLDACRVYLQNVNLPAVLTSAPLIMCGISLGVLVMFNVKLINSTNKPNKQLSLVEQQQLLKVWCFYIVQGLNSHTQLCWLSANACFLLSQIWLEKQFSTFKMYCREAMLQVRNHCKHILLIFCAMSVKWAEAKKYNQFCCAVFDRTRT